MHISFSEQDPNKVLTDIQANMEGRKLAKMVSFDLKGEILTITIKKLGTSTLEFNYKKAGAGLEFDLSKEKIAMSHKAFKGEVTEKIVKIIQKSGGTVS